MNWEATVHSNTHTRPSHVCNHSKQRRCDDFHCWTRVAFKRKILQWSRCYPDITVTVSTHTWTDFYTHLAGPVDLDVCESWPVCGMPYASILLLFCFISFERNRSGDAQREPERKPKQKNMEFVSSIRMIIDKLHTAKVIQTLSSPVALVCIQCTHSPMWYSSMDSCPLAATARCTCEWIIHWHWDSLVAAFAVISCSNDDDDWCSCCCTPSVCIRSVQLRTHTHTSPRGIWISLLVQVNRKL